MGQLEVAKSWSLEEKVTFLGLLAGVRDEVDPVTWRTLVIKSRKLFGSVNDPDNEPVDVGQEVFQPFVQALLGGTWLEMLAPEFERDVTGKVDGAERGFKPLEMLLVNGRHLPEDILFRLAEQVDGEVAVINPVGHFNDGETRILGPSLLRKVKRLVLVASTQAQRGGSYEVLAKVCRLARLAGITDEIGALDVVIPMAGGSRGHRDGEDFGVEVLEAAVNPRILAILMRDILDEVRREFGISFKVSFFSVDLHHVESFKRVFEENGFEFVNVDPSEELAEGLLVVTQEQHAGVGEELVERFFSCDGGAEGRTNNLVGAYMRLADKKGVMLGPVEVVYLCKRRVAGVVKRVWIDRVEGWKLATDGRIIKTRIEKPSHNNPWNDSYRAHFSDDMGDTCGTLGQDILRAREYYPGMVWSDAALTHAVLSKGPGVLDVVDLDYFVFTNTLKPDGLLGREDVLVVDVAPAIYRALLSKGLERY